MEVTNDESVDVGLLAMLDNGQLVTNREWKCIDVYKDHWTDIDFDDSDWPFATEIGSLFINIIYMT